MLYRLVALPAWAKASELAISLTIRPKDFNMGMTSGEAKKAVISVLSKPPIQRISFWCGMHVTPALFFDVKNAVENGKIKVIVVPANLLDDADGEYFPDKNTLAIADTVTSSDFDHGVRTRCLIVHETVHAIADMKKLTISQISSEAAGYLAAAVYRVLSAQPIPSSESQYDYDEAMKNIWKKCDELIYKYGLQLGIGVVSTEDLNDLRNLIHKHSQYADVDLRKMQVADGI